MKKIIIMLIIGLFFINQFVAKSEPSDIPDFSKALDYLKSYRFGMDRAPLEPIEMAFRQVKNNPQKQEELSIELAKILSECSIDGKRLIARYLTVIGTESVVPFVQPLLHDLETLDIGCRILEQIPGQSATRVLVDVLNQETKEEIKIAVLHSIGRRKDISCIDALMAFLNKSEGEIRNAVLFAVASIPSEKAKLGLWNWAKEQDWTKDEFVVQAMLQIGEDAIEQGESNVPSLEIFRKVYSEIGIPSIYRGRALAGLVRLGEEGVFDQVWKDVLSDDEILSSVAFDLLKSSDCPEEFISRKVLDNLLGLNAKKQIALLEVIKERKLSGLTPTIINLLDVDPVEVRISAIDTLGAIGDARCLGPLMRLALNSPKEIRETAYIAISRIPDTSVNELIKEKAQNSDPEERRICVELIGERRVFDGKELLKMFIRERDEHVLSESFSSLSVLGDESDIPFLFECLLKDEKGYSNYVSTITNLLNKVGDEGKRVELVVSNIPQCKEPYQKKAIIELLGNIQSPESCNALFELSARYPEMLEPIIQTVGRCTDADSLEKLFEIVRGSDRNEIKIAGCLSLLNMIRTSDALSDKQKLNCLKEIWAYSTDSVVLQKNIMGNLSQLSLKEAFDFVESIPYHPDVASDWSNVRLSLSKRICFAYPNLTIPVLESSLNGLNEKQAKEIERILSALKNKQNYVCAWSVSGPYRIEGYRADRLFSEVSFPPETNVAEVKDWRILPMKVREDGVIYGDLFEFMKEEVECVAYVCTKISLDTPQKGTLLLGTNDGVKVWLNGKLVHSYPYGRSMNPGEDRISLDFETSNVLLMAIYNQGAQWEFTASLEGVSMQDLKIEPF